MFTGFLFEEFDVDGESAVVVAELAISQGITDLEVMGD